MRTSPITPLHIRHGASMQPEDGWNMPHHFSTLPEEHGAARHGCGIFDISHLGKFSATGNGALAWLEGLLSNSIAHCRDGMGQRTLLLRENGGIIDRLLLFRESAGRFFLLGHAGQREAVYKWISARRQEGPLEFLDETEQWSGMALAGPQSEPLLRRVLPGVELPPAMGFRRLHHREENLLLTRCGITGNEGFELFCRAAAGISWYERFIATGAVPCGTHTQECLRIEHGIPCPARDTEPEHTPLQCGLGHLCRLDKNFIGVEALRRQQSAGTMNRMAAMECRHTTCAPGSGDAVVDAHGQQVGHITSACLSPLSRRGMALAWLASPLALPGTHLQIISEGRPLPAIVLGMPLA